MDSTTPRLHDHTGYALMLEGHLADRARREAIETARARLVREAEALARATGSREATVTETVLGVTIRAEWHRIGTRA